MPQPVHPNPDSLQIDRVVATDAAQRAGLEDDDLRTTSRSPVPSNAASRSRSGTRETHSPSPQHWDPNTPNA